MIWLAILSLNKQNQDYGLVSCDANYQAFLYLKLLGDWSEVQEQTICQRWQVAFLLLKPI